MEIQTGVRDFPCEHSLIREALVREIRYARRWSAIVDAWDALQHVNLMAKQMKEEHDRHENNPESMPDRRE